MKDAFEVHYGQCRIQGFWSLTRNTGNKIQDILLSAEIAFSKISIEKGIGE